MNDLEQQLGGLRRRAPSDRLDARVEATLQRAQPLLTRPVPAWACAAAALLGLVAGGLLMGRPADLVAGHDVVALQLADAGATDARFPFIGRRFINNEEHAP